MAVKKSKPSARRKYKIYIISVIFGIAASVISLLIFSLIVFLLRRPLANVGFLSYMAFGVGCLVAGFTAGSANRHGGLAAGIKAALLFTVPVILLGFVLDGFGFYSTVPSAQASASEQAVVEQAEAPIADNRSGPLSKAVAAVFCGALGGVIGINKNNGFR